MIIQLIIRHSSFIIKKCPKTKKPFRSGEQKGLQNYSKMYITFFLTGSA